MTPWSQPPRLSTLLKKKRPLPSHARLPQNPPKQRLPLPEPQLDALPGLVDFPVGSEPETADATDEAGDGAEAAPDAETETDGDDTADTPPTPSE